MPRPAPGSPVTLFPELTDSELEVVERVRVDFLDLPLEGERELGDGDHVTDDVTPHVTVRETGGRHVGRGDRLDLLDAIEFWLFQDLKCLTNTDQNIFPPLIDMQSPEGGVEFPAWPGRCFVVCIACIFPVYTFLNEKWSSLPRRCCVKNCIVHFRLHI